MGASFEKWPEQMRFITPSFYGNPFGLTDLNAINPRTSPADFAHAEHLAGAQYAAYLRAVADFYELPVRAGVEVQAVVPRRGRFSIQTNDGDFSARFVIWAAGEFNTPDDGGIKGARLCVHNSKVADWSKLEGDAFTLVGGCESGMDAAVNLLRLGKEVHLLSRGEPWGSNDSDPSLSLSPFTRDRLKDALTSAPGRIRFYKNADIKEITRIRDRWFLLDENGEPFESPTAPILCTGFRSALHGVAHLFEQDQNGFVFSEEADESTKTPGLFYSGPSLVHRASLFCFIYKFRSRFGVIARAIAQRLDLEWEEPLRAWRDHGFMNDDLACCTDCQCTVTASAEGPAEVGDYHQARSVHERVPA